MNPLRVTITWLDAVVVFATAAAAATYYVIGLKDINAYGLTISLVQDGMYIAIVYIALELLNAALGEGGNMPLYWLSYLASATACLVITLTAGWVFLGLQQNDPKTVDLLAVPHARDLLIVLLVFSWLSLLVFQSHKHGPAWTQVTAARAIAPPAPLPPTIPAPVAPPVPGSAASVVIVILVILLIAVLAMATLGNGVRFTFNKAADAGDGHIAGNGEKDCSLVKSRTKVGEMSNGAPIYAIEPDC